MRNQPSSSGQPGPWRQSLPTLNPPFFSLSPGSPGFFSRQPRSVMQRYRTDGAYRNEQLAKGLGWFSIGIGMAGLLAPRAISRTIGTPDQPMLMRAIGVREIVSGVGILSQRKPAGWLWARVAGDAMDLALLGAAARYPGARRDRLAMMTAMVAGIAVLDTMSSVQQSNIDTSRATELVTGSVRFEKSITVNGSADDAYRFWHDFENFPRFMKRVESVQRVGANRWRWRVRTPAGVAVEWDAEVTLDRPGQALGWRSVADADVQNAGMVRFEPAAGGRGTVIRVETEYKPPGGKAGAWLAKLLGQDPERQIAENLRNFKRLIETGEIPTTVGQPSGQRGPITRMLFRRGAPG